MKQFAKRIWTRTLRRIGYPGVIALALLVPSLASAVWLPRLQAQSVETRAVLAAKAKAVNRQGPPVRGMSNGEQIAEFVAGLPTFERSPKDLEEVFRIARQHNIPLPKGEYQVRPAPNTPLIVYTATFPLRKDYGALKDFTAEVLTALPHASMDELRMTRADAGAGVLDSVVRFSFVYRGV